MQLMTDMLGGQVAPSPHREFGLAAGHGRDGAIRARCFTSSRRICAYGRATATSSPPRRRASPSSPRSANAPVAAMEAPERGYYALLFHPEVAHTDRGTEILRNFAFDVCGCTGDWTIASFIDEATARITAQVGERPRGLRPRRAASIPPSRPRSFTGRSAIACSASSSTTGCSGSNEAHAGRGALQEAAAAACIFVDAADTFLDAPRRRHRSRAEAKDHRRRRSSTCSNDEATSSDSFDFLAQGTLYPDVIESVSVVGPVGARSRATTTSAACPSACASSWSSRCASCSRTKCARSDATSGIDKEFLVRQPFPARDSRCASSATITRDKLDAAATADAIVAEEVRKRRLA